MNAKTKSNSKGRLDVDPFPIGIGEMFRLGFVGYRSKLAPLSLAGLATFVVYAIFRVPSQMFENDGRTGWALILDLTGLVLAGAVALPWFAQALVAVRGLEGHNAVRSTASKSSARRTMHRKSSGPRSTRGKSSSGKKFTILGLNLASSQFVAMLVCGFWFWAAFMLGLRYLAGIPSMLTVLYYAFYGFVIADEPGLSGLKALGVSVRLGNRRRIGLFALATLYALFNLCGGLALGVDINALTIALAVLGVLITTNITLVGGAALYDVLVADLPENR